jgi:hypothetical protein
MARDNNLDRVTGNLAAPIKSFLNERLLANRPEFRMADLRTYLMVRGLEFAPASPDRILRELRLNGEVLYEVVSRAKSLYRVRAVQYEARDGA